MPCEAHPAQCLLDPFDVTQVYCMHYITGQHNTSHTRYVSIAILSSCPRSFRGSWQDLVHLYWLQVRANIVTDTATTA